MSAFHTTTLSNNPLPLVVQPAAKDKALPDYLQQIADERATLRKQLLEHGGLLFRNFPVAGIEDFTRVMEALELGEFVDYIGGGAPRSKVKGKVYTSTEAPPSIKIQLHNEMSFCDYYPKHICFYCDIPAQQGGQTFIGDSRAIYKDADPALLQRLTERRLKYISRYYHKSPIMELVNKLQRGHKTWIDVFETDQKGEVEKKCKAHNIGYKWNPHDWLEISRLRPATIQHPVTGDTVWFNQAHLFDYNPRFLGWWRYMAMRLLYFRDYTLVDEIRYEDDTPVPREDIYAIHDLLDKHSVYFPWQKGDVLVLDNILTMHGRAPFTGKRRILTAMTK